MSKKIYFSTTEIVPFANVSNIAPFSTAVPTLLQELGHDIRISCPNSCSRVGTAVENGAILETFANGTISVVLKYIFLDIIYVG